MDPISHMPSPRSLSNYFSLLAQPLYFFHLPGVSQQFWCSFSSSFSTSEDRRRVSLKSCPFSWRFMSLAWCYPLKLFPVVQFFFIHPEYFRSCFPSRSSGGHLFGIFLHSKFSYSFSNYSISVPLRSSQYSPGASFKCSLISSWSLCSFASKFPLAYWFS